MSSVLYILLTILESGLAVFGIRSPFEAPRYEVVSTLAPGVEIRRYGPLVAVETTSEGDENAAFSRLFRYISGANAGARRIAMTTPVEMQGKAGAASFAQAKAGLRMRFILPRDVATDPPKPTDPRVEIVGVPAATYAVIRFSGRLDEASILQHTRALETTLARTKRTIEGPPLVFGYDPPFTIPFLRRNEVAIPIAP